MSKPGPSGLGSAMSMSVGGAGLGPGAGSSSTTTQEYTVRVPRDRKKKLSLMKFATGVAVDFAKLGNVPAKLERENNLKEYKTANDLEMMPKFGAGSEFGREQKEEARRKKYGIVLKKYNPDDQPWQLKVGSGKQAKKYRGVREGTVTENTSYYIFTQCADGAFEAFPVKEWYNFSPMIRYKFLNSDEAEEEFLRRDKTLNYFNIMLKKRVKNEDRDADLDDEEKAFKSKASKSGKKNRDFLLTDMDDWAELSDDDDDGEEGDEDGEEKSKEDGDKEKKKKKAKKKGGRPAKKVKNAKQNSDDEAIEESDEGDFDDKEVDYISDSSSSGNSEPEEKNKKYDEKGVADEGGLRNILNSDDEDEDEEETKEEEEIEEEEKKDEEKPPKEKKGDESSSSSSDSDSDIEKDEKFSVILMQKDRADRKKGEKGEKGDGKGSSAGTDQTSRPGKRKAEADGTPAKKSKKDPSAPSPSYYSSSNDGITEDTIRRYLQRKPMTTKDLLQKFRSKKLNMTIEQMSNMIAQLLKRINPERSTINKKLYLSLKKPE